MYAGTDLYDVQVECARRCLRVDLVGTLWEFYTRHNPAKCATIPDILDEWAGAEDDLLSELRAKYGNAALATAATAAAAAAASPPPRLAGPPPTHPSPSRGDDPQRTLLNNIIRRDTSPLVQRQRPYSRSPVRGGGRNGPAGTHNHHHHGGMSPDSLAQRRLLGSVLADSPPHADPTRGQSPDVDHTLLRQEATDEARMDLEVAREHAKLRAAAAAGGGAGAGGEAAAAAAGLPGSPAYPRRTSPAGRRSFSPPAFSPLPGGGGDDDIARFAADALRGIPQLAAASARRPPRVRGASGGGGSSLARALPARALAGAFPEAAATATATDAVSAGLDRSLDQLEEALEVVRRRPVQAVAYRPQLTQQQQQQRTFPATAAADAAAAAVPTGDAAIPPSSRNLIAQLAGFLNGDAAAAAAAAGGSPPRGAREAEQAVRVRLFDDAATTSGGGAGPPDAAEQRYRNLLQDLSAYQDKVEGVVRRPIDSEKRIRAADRSEARAELRRLGGVSPRDAELLRGLGLSHDEIALLAPPELSHDQAAPAAPAAAAAAAAVSPTQPLRPAEQAHASRLRGSSPPPQHVDEAGALPPRPRLLVWGVRSSSGGVEVDLSERFDGVLMSDMAYLFVSLADAARPCEAWYWIGRDAAQAVADAAFSHACTKVHAVAPLAPQRRVFEGEEPPEFLVMLSARGVELSLFLRTPITRSPGSLKLLVVKPFSSAHLCVAELPCCLEAVADRTAATPGAAHYFLLLSHNGLWVLGDDAAGHALSGGGVSPALLGQKFTGRCPHLAYRGCQPLGRAAALGLRPADAAQRRALDATLVRRLAYQSLVIQPLLLRVRWAGGDGAAPAAAGEACSFTVLNVRKTGERVALQDVRAGLTDPLGGGVVALIAHRTALRVWVRAGGPRPPSPVERATHLAACDAFIAQNGLPPDFPVVLAFEGAEPAGFFPSDMFC